MGACAYEYLRRDAVQDAGNQNRQAENNVVQLHLGYIPCNLRAASIGLTYFGAYPFGLNGAEPQFSPGVDNTLSGLFGQGDALPLSLADQRALKLGERAHHRQHEVRHRRILAGEREVLLDELDADATPRQCLHDGAKVVEIAREAVHAVDDHRIAGAGERGQRLQLRPFGVLARSLVGKPAVQRNVLKLPFGILVIRADAHVADALAGHGSP